MVRVVRTEGRCGRVRSDKDKNYEKNLFSEEHCWREKSSNCGRHLVEIKTIYKGEILDHTSLAQDKFLEI